MKSIVSEDQNKSLNLIPHHVRRNCYSCSAVITHISAGAMLLNCNCRIKITLNLINSVDIAERLDTHLRLLSNNASSETFREAFRIIS